MADILGNVSAANSAQQGLEKKIDIVLQCPAISDGNMKLVEDQRHKSQAVAFIGATESVKAWPVSVADKTRNVLQDFERQIGQVELSHGHSKTLLSLAAGGSPAHRRGINVIIEGQKIKRPE